jgi:cell division protein FtsB
MGPFEVAALAIIGGLSYSAFDSYNKNKGKGKSQDVTDLKEQLDKLKQRVSTLETIVTDKSYQLKDEINKL